MRIFTYVFSLLFYYLLTPISLSAQSKLTLSEAIQHGVDHFATIQSKKHQLESSKANVSFTQSEALPNFNVSGQWSYGTVNGLISPGYGFGGLGVASSGLPNSSQNWNSAFGSTYIANVNWDIFTFGKIKARNKTAENIVDKEASELEQLKFQHTVKIISTYLNALTSQKIRSSFEKNLERALTMEKIVANRAKGGLIPGVDSSLAQAEVSNAKLQLIKAQDAEQEYLNQLAFLTASNTLAIQLDSSYVSTIPLNLTNNVASTTHPFIEAQKSRLNVNLSQQNFSKALYYPTVSAVGVFQTRGSGFGSTYASNPLDYSHSVWQGLKPVRSNYVLGLGITWNLTQPLRYSHQLRAQQYQYQSIESDIRAVQDQLAMQVQVADAKLQNSLVAYRETPVQIEAASKAYHQKYVLYQTGLTNFVDVQQTLYALVRAETDKAVATVNVWQNLLLKAAATGDLSSFHLDL